VVTNYSREMHYRERIDGMKMSTPTTSKQHN